MKEKYCEMIWEIIQQIKPSVLNIAKDGSQRLIEDLELDSIGIMSLLVEVEDKFKVRFDYDSIMIDNFETIGKLAEFIEGITSGVETEF